MMNTANGGNNACSKSTNSVCSRRILHLAQTGCRGAIWAFFALLEISSPGPSSLLPLLQKSRKDIYTYCLFLFFLMWNTLSIKYSLQLRTTPLKRLLQGAGRKVPLFTRGGQHCLSLREEKAFVPTFFA